MGELKYMDSEETTALVPTSGERDLLSVSMDYVFVIVFQTSRSPSYPMAAAMARNASFYEESKQGKTTHHAAGFSNTEEQLARAATISSLIGSLKGTFFIVRGRMVHSSSGIISVIECCLKSFQVQDHRAHCNVLYPSQFTPGIAGSYIKITGMTKNEQAVIPCAYVAQYTGWSISHEHPASMRDQFRSVCVKRGCDWCPRCNPDDFRFIVSS